MSRYPVTPGEMDRLIDYLAPVPIERHEAVAEMVFEQVGTCPVCGHPIRAGDPRRLVNDQLRHLACDPGSS